MNNIYLIELIKNQINISENKLFIKEMQRIVNNIDNSIFDKNNCCLWKGPKILKPNNKGYYVNFYINGKKLSLQRILYSNYIGELNKNQYICFTCNSDGLCCNINHIKKKNNKNIEIIKSLNKIKKIPSKNNLIITEENNNKLKIIFN